MMKFLYQLLGMGLILLGVYFLGRNIVFTTNPYPYFWRGISADLSILSLTIGIAGVFILPSSAKSFGWSLIGLGILFVFLSSVAILAPTSLWYFVLSLGSMMAGMKLITDRNFGG